MKWSWIIFIIGGYVLSVLLYMFKDTGSEFWGDYFWIDCLLICIAGWAFNFIPKKTIYELAFILFYVCLKVLTLIYYIVGLLLHKRVWMDTNLSFIIMLAVSSFCGMIFWRIKQLKKAP